MSVVAPALTLQAVAQAGRGLRAPFRLALRPLQLDPALQSACSGAGRLELVCQEIYRLLPGRRLVARVAVGGDVAAGGEVAVMKLFLGRDAPRYQRREARGCRAMARAGAATPRLLGLLEGGGDGLPGRALLFQLLADTAPVQPDDRAAVNAAAAQLGKLHRAGCRYLDLHLDNFLRRADGTVFVIDGDGVRCAGGPLRRRRSIEDLAVLCAQRPPLHDQHLAEVYRAYRAERGWPEAGAAPLDGLAAATRRQRHARVRKYLGKAQRDCTEFHQASSWRRRVVAVREAWDDALAAFADDPEAVVRGGRMLKDGNSATVVRVRLGDHWRVIKRYNVKGAGHALRRALKPMARFRLAWLNGQRLHFLGIPTARPLALVEQRRGPWRGVAYLVMEDLGDRDLAGEVETSGLSEARLAQVVELFRALDAAELVHGDTKASNFLVVGDGLALVDLDAMRQRSIGGGRQARKDRERFLANFAGRPELRERVRGALAAGSPGFAAPARSL